MKNKPSSKSVFFNLRVSTAVAFCLTAIVAVLLAMATTDRAHGNGAVGADKSNIGRGATPPIPPGSCGWSAGPNMPSVGVRSVGIYFPADFQRSRRPQGGVPAGTVTLPHGKFYAMGGRSSDTAGSDFTHPFEYDPAINEWIMRPATYPDNQVSNMACGVLNVTGGDYIYCVGGSAAGATTATDRVFRYNPVTESVITIDAPWPGALGTTLPGGFAVYNNKLYILGGFNINVGMVDTIWEFTPDPAGWVQKTAHLPTALGYMPTASIGNVIFTGGGSTWDGTNLHDSNFSFGYDPVADTIANIASIPRATSETRGLNFCFQLWVMGGGRDAPNPSNEVDIYDPGTNSWSIGVPFVNARRDFPTDTDGSNRIVIAGGYAPTDPTDSMESFDCPVSPCLGSISPTPTVSPSPTPTTTAMPSATPSATIRPTGTPRTTPTPRATPTPP